MKQGIKNIIFDLGGVIINIDYQATIDAFKNLDIPNFDLQFSQAIQSDFFERFEIGAVTDVDFFDYIRTISGVYIPDAQITAAWNAMLLDIPLRRIQILQQLQLHYTTILFSNTNVIHEAAFNDRLYRLCGIQNFAHLFDAIYLSHRARMRKPDFASFTTILQHHQLEASETLFIDDSKQHIDAAAQLGIHTIHLAAGMTIENDIFRPLHS